jgi:hypothetical protein
VGPGPIILCGRSCYAKHIKAQRAVPRVCGRCSWSWLPDALRLLPMDRGAVRKTSTHAAAAWMDGGGGGGVGMGVKWGGGGGGGGGGGRGLLGRRRLGTFQT